MDQQYVPQQPVPPVVPQVPVKSRVAIKKPSKKSLIMGIGIGVLVVVVGFTVVLAAKIWDPMWNPFSPNPSKVVKQAFINMSELDSLHSKVTLAMDMEQGGNPVSFAIVVESDSDMKDKEHVRSSHEMDIRMEIPGSGVEVVAGAEMLEIDNVLYFRITSIPFIITAQMSQLGIDITQWQNKWYNFDPQELGVSMAGLGLSITDRLALGRDLQDLYLDHPIAKPIKKLDSEAIGGQMTYHYLMALDKKNLKEFVVALPLILEQYDTFKSSGFTEEEKEEMYANVDKFFEDTGGFEFEIWIGKKDRLIYRMAAAGDLPASFSEETQDTGDVAIDFVVLFSDFNEPVEISVPQESESVIQIIMGMMNMFGGNGLLGGAPASAKDSMIQSAVHELRMNAELIWAGDGSYATLCTSGRLNTANPKLKDLRDDVISQGSDVTCYAGSADYCMSAQLQSGNYFCVDSDGRVVETEGSVNSCTFRRECTE